MKIFRHLERISYRINLGCEGIQIYKEIDPLCFKGTHAGTVVLRWIHMIDSNSIRSQVLHLLCIAFTL